MYSTYSTIRGNYTRRSEENHHTRHIHYGQFIPTAQFKWQLQFRELNMSGQVRWVLSIAYSANGRKNQESHLLTYPPPRLHHYPIRLTGDPLDHRRKLRSVSLRSRFFLLVLVLPCARRHGRRCDQHRGGGGDSGVEGRGGISGPFADYYWYFFTIAFGRLDTKMMMYDV
jgi:hypothetical protein